MLKTLQKLKFHQATLSLSWNVVMVGKWNQENGTTHDQYWRSNNAWNEIWFNCELSRSCSKVCVRLFCLNEICFWSTGCPCNNSAFPTTNAPSPWGTQHGSARSTAFSLFEHFSLEEDWSAHGGRGLTGLVTAPGRFPMVSGSKGSGVCPAYKTAGKWRAGRKRGAVQNMWGLPGELQNVPLCGLVT